MLRLDAENLARDKNIRERVLADWVPMAQQARRERIELRDRWVRYVRMWHSRREIVEYNGRTRVFVPASWKLIESWTRRVKRDLFPDNDWFQVIARNEASEPRVAAVTAASRYFLSKYMNVRRHSTRFVRQMVTLGTGVVRNIWRVSERERSVIEDVLDDLTGEPTGKTRKKLEKLTQYLGPTFEPVSLFQFYVWPTTVADVDQASMRWEEMLLSRGEIERLMSTPLDERNKKAGNVFEDRAGMRTLLDTLDDVSRGTGGGSESHDAVRRLLRDKGFTHPLDQTVPAKNRPVDISQGMWRTDLGEGERDYLVTVACDRVVTRVQENPFIHGGGMHLVGKFMEVQDEFYGVGLPQVFESIQHFMNSVADQAGDALLYALNPIAVVDLFGVQDAESIVAAPGAKWLAALNAVRFEQPPQQPAQTGFGALGQLLGLTNDVANVTPSAALGAAPRGRSRSQQTAAGMQMALAEGAVDTREVVEGLEDSVYSQLLSRNCSMIQQFLDRKVLLKVAGRDAGATISQEIGAADIAGEFDFQWLGSLQTLNLQVRAQQMVNFLGMVSSVPPEIMQQQGVTLDFAYLLREIWGTGMGLRNPERIIRDIEPKTSLDWRLENQMLLAGRTDALQVHGADDHQAHLEGHDRLLQSRRLTPEQEQALTAHNQEHAERLVMAQLQSIMQSLGPPANGNGAGPDIASGAGLVRPPAPVGPGRLAQTATFDDLLRQAPRGT